MFMLTIPNSGERALWWMWLRQRALLALAANLLGRLAVFVRWGPQDDEGESALPNPHSHSHRSLWSRKAPGGRCSAWYGALVVAATELGVHAAGRLTHSRRVLEIGERFACLSHYSHDR